MALRAILAALVMVFVIVIVTVTLPAITAANEDVRTDSAQETGLSCSTGVGETTCTLTLAAAHAYPDTSGMVVTETSPGSTDRTSAATVQADRTMVALTGLTASTSYMFTVDYAVVATNVSSGLNAFLSFVPFLWGFGGLVMAAVAVVVGYSLYLKQR